MYHTDIQKMREYNHDQMTVFDVETLQLQMRNKHKESQNFDVPRGYIEYNKKTYTRALSVTGQTKKTQDMITSLISTTIKGQKSCQNAT